jgi:DNA polymerase-3 subunit epsilon
MREIALDTETTGLDPSQGHRIIEICCIELENHLPTDQIFHTLVDPERDIPEEATRVHGLTRDKLADAPPFADVADEFLAFIGEAPLVIHNAEFDLKFLNAELERIAKPSLPASRGIDTIQIAKRRFPGARYSLDDLCRRFNIDLSARSRHSAKVDTELLAQVYLELIGGRQAHLQLAPWESGEAQAGGGEIRTARQRPKALSPRLHAAERENHARFVAAELTGDVLWRWGKS